MNPVDHPHGGGEGRTSAGILLLLGENQQKDIEQGIIREQINLEFEEGKYKVNFVSRSIWKGPFVDGYLLKKKLPETRRNDVKTWSRRSTIMPQFVGLTFGV